MKILTRPVCVTGGILAVVYFLPGPVLAVLALLGFALLLFVAGTP
jgi:hypothetical protein